MARRACLHCGKDRYIQSRGLCGTCHKDRAIRALHRPLKDSAPDPEPTEADLERMIAEQMADLPAWWEREERAKLGGARRDDGSDVPQALRRVYIARGIGFR